METAVPAPVPSKDIQTSVGRRVLGRGRQKVRTLPQSREQGVGPLKKLPTTPDQCWFSLCPEMALVEPRLALSMLSCRWQPSVPHL